MLWSYQYQYQPLYRRHHSDYKTPAQYARNEQAKQRHDFTVDSQPCASGKLLAEDAQQGHSSIVDGRY
jgi:hypothetical protein